MEFADDLASSRIILDEGTENERVLTKCDQCRELWRGRNERGIVGKPPCNTCRVDLLEKNKDAAEIYTLARRQVVTADQGQIIDINIPAVKIVMDLYGVKDQKDCLLKVRNLFHHFENKRRKE